MESAISEQVDKTHNDIDDIITIESNILADRIDRSAFFMFLTSMVLMTF